MSDEPQQDEQPVEPEPEKMLTVLDQIGELLEDLLDKYPSDSPGPPGGYTRADGKEVREWLSEGKACKAIIGTAPTVTLTPV